MSAFSRASRRTESRPPDLLPPATRPVRPEPRLARRPDVVDAVFEVIPAGRAPIPPIVNDNRRGAMPEVQRPRIPAGAGLLARGEDGLRRLSGRAFAALTAGLCLAVFLLVTMSSTEPGPVSTLDIADVATVLADAGGLRVVTVYGAVVNRTGRTMPEPLIRVDLVSDGRPVRAEGKLAGAGPIASGETRRFSARLPHAGSAAPAVKISFTPTDASPSGL